MCFKRYGFFADKAKFQTMNMKLLAAGVALAFLPFFCNAQEKVKIKQKDDGTTKVKMDDEKVKIKSAPPSWANAHGYRNNMHVYFPDYYTFYDPNRGYTYWDGDSWETTMTMPAFIADVDLNAARVEILNNARLEEHPELKYDIYMREFTAKPVTGVTVIVPPMR